MGPVSQAFFVDGTVRRYTTDTLFKFIERVWDDFLDIMAEPTPLQSLYLA